MDRKGTAIKIETIFRCVRALKPGKELKRHPGENVAEMAPEIS